MRFSTTSHSNQAQWPVLATLIVCLGVDSFAQGPLTPPGSPAPSMKTLQQVEPRTPIASLPFTISTPGSYYLTTNLTGVASDTGISISASGVTIDLNGFEMVGVTGSQEGVLVKGAQHSVHIRNGTIRNWGWHGVDASLATASMLTDLRAYTNGWENFSQDGLRIGANSLVKNCVSTANELSGINAGSGCTIKDCTVAANQEDGIVVASGCQVTGNNSIGNRAGIFTTGSVNRITGNHATDNQRGLEVSGEDNYLADNTVMGNTDNYALGAGNQLNLLLGELPESIDWPASVRLAGTLTGTAGANGITINASDVTLDLDGHALVGIPGSLAGIAVPTHQYNIAVRNGTIRGWGRHGVDADNADNSILMDLRAYTNGWGSSTQDGLRIGSNSLVKECVAEANQNDGISANDGNTIRDCSAGQNGNNGIQAGSGCTVIACTAHNNGNDGIAASVGCTISDCTARVNGGDGISCASHNSIRGCTASRNQGDGIQVFGRCYVTKNNCADNGRDNASAGIHATGPVNRIEGNTMDQNWIGLRVGQSFNLIIRNSVSGSGPNYEISASNRVGPIVLAPLSPAISGTTGGSGVGSTDPWANFSF